MFDWFTCFCKMKFELTLIALLAAATATRASESADTGNHPHTFHDEEKRHMEEDHHMGDGDYDEGTKFFDNDDNLIERTQSPFSKCMI